MRKDKKKQGKTEKKEEKTLAKVVSSEQLAKVKSDLLDIDQHYEILLAEFKAITNRIRWKEASVVSERGKLLKEHSDVAAVALDLGLIEETLSRKFWTDHRTFY